MTILVVVGFPDETTASAAAEHLHRIAPDVQLDADAAAVISQDVRGTLHVTTHHQQATGRLLRGVSWLPLLGSLCFTPMFGMPASGPWRAVMQRLDRSGVVRSLREPVLDMLQPGSSMLFLLVDPAVSVAPVLRALRGFSGTVVTVAVPQSLERDLQRDFHGSDPAPSPGRRRRTGRQAGVPGHSSEPEDPFRI